MVASLRLEFDQQSAILYDVDVYGLLEVKVDRVPMDKVPMEVKVDPELERRFLNMRFDEWGTSMKARIALTSAALASAPGEVASAAARTLKKLQKDQKVLLVRARWSLLPGLMIPRRLGAGDKFAIV